MFKNERFGFATNFSRVLEDITGATKVENLDIISSLPG
jgi:hypothetical protein